MIITEQTFEKARKRIKELQNKKQQIIFSSDDDELNRKILEKEKIDILLLNQKDKKDFAKQRNSGLNQVLAKIAKKNNIKIGINLDEIIDAKNKSQILARVRQNIKLCNKYKIQIKFISEKCKRNSHDLKALGLTLGIPSAMTKNL